MEYVVQMHAIRFPFKLGMGSQQEEVDLILTDVN